MVYGQSSYTYVQPKEHQDGWKTNHINSQQIDSVIINKLFSQLKSENHKLHSVLLVKENQLILEEYFNDYQFNQVHDLRSVTKSIQALLLGIAIDKGFISSVNDPIHNYLKNPIPKNI